MLIDYHLHNHFSPDSEEDTSKIAKRSLESGVREICITNHVEWFNVNNDDGETFSIEEATDRFSRVKKDIDKIKNNFPGLGIKFGAELEYVEEWMPEMKRFVKSMDFDFLLGSMHVVNNVVISTEKYAQNLYEKVDEKEAYNKYFEELYKLVEWGEFDAVGHFDINKKYGHEAYGKFDPKKYKSKIMPILELMAKKGIGIELNTGSMHARCHELFPHPEILKWCLEAGVEHYTLGSDAHEEKEVNRHLKEALGIMKEVGIKTISTYEKRVPTKHRI